ncbi:hypothetical protein EV182_002421 [Spiromyces aspiralis]|uniref:Uncharacterized protein n=1 Tax=Spiromyces aspiralis TaxID=68401 RepID=A0ACC1HEG9_9FUNG|nr:hypothetical protein EV182_002421 [Spiromyces aspiralis]
MSAPESQKSPPARPSPAKAALTAPGGKDGAPSRKDLSRPRNKPKAAALTATKSGESATGDISSMQEDPSQSVASKPGRVKGGRKTKPKKQAPPPAAGGENANGVADASGRPPVSEGTVKIKKSRPAPKPKSKTKLTPKIEDGGNDKDKDKEKSKSKSKPKPKNKIEKQATQADAASPKPKQVRILLPNNTTTVAEPEAKGKVKKNTSSQKRGVKIPRFKVAIRRLPPRLPEHIFWKSVEPCLPWYDETKTGEVKLVDKEVPIETGPESLMPVPATNSHDDENHDHDQQQQQQQQSTEAEDPSKSKVQGTISDMPTARAPTRVIQVEEYYSPNLAVLDKKPYWRHYIPGKIAKSASKVSTFSRAFILFASEAEVAHFSSLYDRHVFIDKSGTKMPAIVEMAPYQGFPYMRKMLRNPLENTIEQDPHFFKFLKSLSKSVDAEGGSGSSTGQAELAPPMVTGGECIANPSAVTVAKPGLASSLLVAPPLSSQPLLSAKVTIAGNIESQTSETVASTPLIDYIRKIKSKGRTSASKAEPTDTTMAPRSKASRKKAAAATAPSNSGSPTVPQILKKKRKP